MSALGQKQTFALQNAMSALPPIADICSALAHVCFVPITDIEGLRERFSDECRSTRQDNPDLSELTRQGGALALLPQQKSLEAVGTPARMRKYSGDPCSTSNITQQHLALGQFASKDGRKAIT